MLLGIDIGGTKCAIVLGRSTGDDGQMEIRDKVVLPTDKPVDEMMAAIMNTTERMLADKSLTHDDIDGIGICCGGPLDSKAGTILSPPNLPGWDNIPVVDRLQARFGKRAILQNDANACAVAEWKYGAGRGYQNIIFLTFGTGMGAGLILNGQLYAGTTDAAGEAGHMRLVANGPVGFGKAGSFEGFCSGGGIAQLAQAKARELLQMGKTPSFCQAIDELPLINAKMVADAAYKGDEAAVDVYKTCGRHLGKGLSLLIDILNPEVIILGGIYARSQSLIEPYMREAIEKEALPGSYQACRILPAGLGESIGDMAALALADMACYR
jgi:glucokinase